MRQIRALELTEEDLIDKVKFNHDIMEIETKDLRSEAFMAVMENDLVIFRGRETRILKDRYGYAGKVLPIEKPSRRRKPQKT